MMLVGYVYPSVYVSGNRKRRHEEIRLQLPFVLDLADSLDRSRSGFHRRFAKSRGENPFGPAGGRNRAHVAADSTRYDTCGLDARSWPGVSIFQRPLRSSRFWSLRTRWEVRSAPCCGPNRSSSACSVSPSAEKKGAAASQKLLFPLIFFIMPAVFIMIFGPVILGFLGGGK